VANLHPPLGLDLGPFTDLDATNHPGFNDT
jgi:hypothetical protein